MPDFDVFSLLEIRKRKSRSHGKRQKGNDIPINDLSTKFRDIGRHAMLSLLSSLPIPVLFILYIEANRFMREVNTCVMLHF